MQAIQDLSVAQLAMMQERYTRRLKKDRARGRRYYESNKGQLQRMQAYCRKYNKAPSQVKWRGRRAQTESMLAQEPAPAPGAPEPETPAGTERKKAGGDLSAWVRKCPPVVDITIKEEKVEFE